MVNKITTALAAVATLLGVFNVIKAQNFEETQSQRQTDFKIYESIDEAVEHENPKKIRALKTIVTHMAGQDFKDEFLTVLNTGESEIFKKEEKELEKQIIDKKNQNYVNRKATFNWEDVDYDVFWCSSSGLKAEAQAQEIVNRLKDEGAKGRLRVRVLPDSINKLGGYQVEGYAIRRNANENAQATALKKMADETLSANFDIQGSATDTPWYISAFVCPK